MSAEAIEVVIADQAIERLVAHARRGRWRGALLVCDPNTRRAAAARVGERLQAAGIPTRQLLLGDGEPLLADPEQVRRVGEALTPDAWPVAVGSGVITDIVRYAAHRAGRDFLSVPTAASMDGYASAVAALQRDGVKVTLPARAPRAIFADPRIAAEAPAALTRSGLGDLLAKASARVDWLAAHLLYGEAYLPQVAQRVLAPLQSAAQRAGPVLAGERDAVAGLLEGLVQSGIAMALAGSSRPASGFEHHASHFWDLLAARGLRPHHPHGLQVGFASRLAIALQRFAFAGGVTSLSPPRPPADPLGAEARRWLGDPAPEIRAAVDEKQRFAAQLSCWPADARGWERVRATLAPELERFATVLDALDRAGIPSDPRALDLDEEMLEATVRHATRLRSRYTVVDFLEGQGALQDAIRALSL